MISYDLSASLSDNRIFWSHVGCRNVRLPMAHLQVLATTNSPVKAQAEPNEFAYCQVRISNTSVPFLSRFPPPLALYGLAEAAGPSHVL